jgi:biopolymer transport protein ExbD
MKFNKHRPEDPEINLIPFIDVLLVVLIFLMLSTTYSKFTELQVNLPTANADRPKDNPREIIVSISGDGRFAINRKTLDLRNVEAVTAELVAASGGNAETIVIVSADAATPHQAVITAMDAARRAGLVRLTFAAQVPGNGEAAR